MSPVTTSDVSVEPVLPVSRRWVTRFSLIWFGVWAATLVPVQLALPDQLDAIDHAHRVRDFGIINGVVGVAAVLTLPLFGALCDRTRTPWGRRRTWVGGGVAVFAIGLVLTGLQTHVVLLALCWLVASLGGNMISAGLTAVVADDVPDSQRGLVSGAIYGPQAIGIVVGLVAVTGLAAGGRYLALAVGLVLLSLPFVLGHREQPGGQVPPLSLAAIVGGLWVDPRANPDFGWAFAGRLMVNLGNALATSILLFFLRDDLKVPDPDQSLLILTLVYLVFTVVATYLGGIISDRTGRRRFFVAEASALQAIAAILLALHPAMDSAIVGAALLGAGYGAYMSVDQALVTAVLPDASDRAKDLGIMNIGSVGPQASGPLLAAVVISTAGYPTLFLLAGVVTTLGTVMVYRIRSVP